MRFDFFARPWRIVAAASGLWIAGWTVATVLGHPHVTSSFVVERPGAAPVPVEQCEDGDVREFADVDDDLSVMVCFKATQRRHGQRLLAYARDDKGESLAAPLDAKEIQRYTHEVAVDLVDHLIERHMADELRAAARIAQWKDAMGSMAIGLALGWGLFLSAGRIGRALLRVPKAMAPRPES